MSCRLAFVLVICFSLPSFGQENEFQISEPNLGNTSESSLESDPNARLAYNYYASDNVGKLSLEVRSSRQNAVDLTPKATRVQMDPQMALHEPESGIEYHRTLSIHPTGLAPQLEVRLNSSAKRAVSAKSVTFESGNFAHRSLLFEEPLLERHGLSRRPGVQPFVSGAKFLGHSAFLPIELLSRRHQRCDGSLGWGTPGSQNPICDQ